MHLVRNARICTIVFPMKHDLLRVIHQVLVSCDTRQDCHYSVRRFSCQPVILHSLDFWKARWKMWSLIQETLQKGRRHTNTYPIIQVVVLRCVRRHWAREALQSKSKWQTSPKYTFQLDPIHGQWQKCRHVVQGPGGGHLGLGLCFAFMMFRNLTPGK